MGKETKIGLTVIVVLLVGLGVAIANRMTNSEEEPVASYSQDEKSGTEKEKRATAKDTGQKKTTVLTPKATAVSPPKGSAPTASPWSVVSDKSAGGQGRSSTTVAVSPPSYMPKAPTTVSVAPASRYGGSEVPTSDQTRQYGSHAQRYPQGRTLPGAAGLPPAPPVAAAAQRPMGEGYNRANPGSYASNN
jgi:hypothetical protein